MIQKFILDLLVQAAKNEEIRAFVFDLVDQLGDKVKDDLLPELLPKLVALLPVFGAGLIKEVFDRAPNLPDISNLDDVVKGVAGKILDSDPDIPILSGIVDFSEILRGFLR